MKLFIAEKPSLAKAIAEEIGVKSRSGGSIACNNDTVVTWCFGHLLEQAEPDEYLPDGIPLTSKGKKRWRLKDLPIFPKEWVVEPKNDAGVTRQLKLIGELIGRAETVVNAGDPDREGQLLVDEVIEHFGCTKPVERFWVSAVDPASIRKGLKELRENARYAGMRDAAQARSRADWLLGMNLSRAYTLLNKVPQGENNLITVGRVQTPTLTMVARRDYAVRNFKPVPYLVIGVVLTAKDRTFTARHKPRDDQKGLDAEGKYFINLDLARALAEKLKSETTATVVSAETKRRKLQPPKAYSLADIQVEANRTLGLSAEDTLNICQSLYEVHKITSYPRTDCGYLPESQHAEAPDVLKAIAATFPAAAAACAKADPKLKSQTFNDKKISAHHGIVPVANTADWSRLNDREKAVYRLIAKRYIAQFYPVHTYDATEIVFTIGGETFTSKGKVIIDKGWKLLYEKPEKPVKAEEPKDAGKTESAEDDQTLPKLKKGETAQVNEITTREDKTKPPLYFTEGTLIAAMENIWRAFEDENLQKQLKDAGGIGTPATRAAIISELKRRGFLETEGKKLHCSTVGRNLLLKVSPKIRSAVMTARFEEMLKEVEAGKAGVNDFVAQYEAFILTEINEAKRQAWGDPF